VRDDPGPDPRGQLWNEDCTRRLNWDDYCHFCYVGCPLESSADKGLAVYARSRASVCGQLVTTPWKKVWVGPAWKTNECRSVEDALVAAGCEVSLSRTGHPPKD
jgi:hypothetical protein